MVRVIYEDIDGRYGEVKDSACGRKACSVMILVASEVDAMASARMLTQMLRTDNIAYNLRPVSNYAQIEAVKSTLISADSDIRTIFMINCGAVSYSKCGIECLNILLSPRILITNIITFS